MTLAELARWKERLAGVDRGDAGVLAAMVEELLAEVEQMYAAQRCFQLDLNALAHDYGDALAAREVAQAALRRIHNRTDITPSMRTITEHALRNERWDDTVLPGGWVCAICGRPSESEPCPQHGHTGAAWCCDTCKAKAEDDGQ